MENQVTNAAINTGFILVIIILFGLLIEGIQHLLGKSLARLFGAKFANTFMNRITFIGVMHHELSHALFALLTGAKITAIHLFKPDEQTGSLGSVSYATRGPLVLRAIQSTLASMAPTICGTISVVCICKFGFSDVIWKNILFGCLLLCIVIHMNMSTQDIKVALKGLPICLLIVFVIFYYAKIDIISSLLATIK